MKQIIKEFEKEHWFFYTTTILNFIPLLRNKQYADIVINSLKFLVENQRIYLGGYVLMPNHLHLILKTRNNHKLEHINRDFKKYTAQKIILKMKDNKDEIIRQFEVNKKDRIVQIWKRDPKIQNIETEKFLLQKLDYIHRNPCQERWQLVEKSEDYLYSSASYYILNTVPIIPIYNLFTSDPLVGDNTNKEHDTNKEQHYYNNKNESRNKTFHHHRQ